MKLNVKKLQPGGTVDEALMAYYNTPAGRAFLMNSPDSALDTIQQASTTDQTETGSTSPRKLTSAGLSAAMGAMPRMASAGYEGVVAPQTMQVHSKEDLDRLKQESKQRDLNIQREEVARKHGGAQEQYVKDVKAWLIKNKRSLYPEDRAKYAAIVGEDFMKELNNPKSKINLEAAETGYLTGEKIKSKTEEEARAASSKAAEFYFQDMLGKSLNYNDGSNPEYLAKVEKFAQTTTGNPDYRLTPQELQVWTKRYQGDIDYDNNREAMNSDYRAAKKKYIEDEIKSIRDATNATASQMVGVVGAAVNSPGHIVHSLIQGRREGEDWSDLAKRVSQGIIDPRLSQSGSDTLEHYGVEFGDGIGGDVARFGADVALDPMTVLTGGQP